VLTFVIETGMVHAPEELEGRLGALESILERHAARQADPTHDAFSGEVYRDVMPYPPAKSTHESPDSASTLGTSVGIIRKAALCR
jgi:hypothetical protein